MRQPLLFKKIELKKLYSKIIYVALVFLFWAKAVLSQTTTDITPELYGNISTTGLVLPEPIPILTFFRLSKVVLVLFFLFPIIIISVIYLIRFIIAKLRKKPQAVWLLRKSGLFGLLIIFGISVYLGLVQFLSFVWYDKKTPSFVSSFGIREFQMGYAYLVIAVCIFVLFVYLTRRYKRARAVEKAAAKQVAPKVTDPPPSA